jgi:hypothetical protein
VLAPSLYLKTGSFVPPARAKLYVAALYAMFLLFASAPPDPKTIGNLALPQLSAIDVKR